MNHTSVEVDVDKTATVEELEEAVRRSVGCGGVCLVYDGKRLKDGGRTLGEVGIEEGRRVVYIPIKEPTHSGCSAVASGCKGACSERRDDAEDTVVEFGDESIEEIAEEVECEDPELAALIRANPSVINEIIENEMGMCSDEESDDGYGEEMGVLELEGAVYDAIRAKLGAGCELSVLESQILNEDDEAKTRGRCIAWKLEEMGYPARVAEEAGRNCMTLGAAVEYCEMYMK